MWNLFGKSRQKEKKDVNIELVDNWSFLRTDMHSHLIPGIDDGAQTLEDSILLIEQLQAMGFKSLVTTPHIKQDHFPNTRDSIQNGLEILTAELKARGIEMPVKAAAEYYLDDYFIRLLEINELMTITGNEVLIELSFISEPVRFYDILFKIQTAGYRPILAHPERYPFYHDRLNVFTEIKSRGCLLQLNTISLTGYYGRPVKQAAMQLLKDGLYDYCGSDIHHQRHAETLVKMIDAPVFNDLQRHTFKNSSITI